METNAYTSTSSSPLSSSNSVAALRANTLPDNPFVGLRPFNSNEGLLFFGRRDQTLELLEQLHKTRFLAVVGSSGCGKSSLIRAGLIPKLKAGFLLEQRDQWRVVVMKPGDAPMENLAQSLVEAISDSPDEDATASLVSALKSSCSQAVLEYLEPRLEASGANVLLLVDQFEELFSFARYKESETKESGEPVAREQLLAETTERERRRDEATDFVSIMLGLARQKDLPIYVVMTMRSDFLGDCDSFFGLPEAMNRSQYLVPRLTRQQRQEAIENPIILYGKKVTPRMLDNVLNDAGDHGDQLPVMQHAMMRTWEKWRVSQGESIDLPDYEAAGTTKRALSEDAEEALEGLDEADLKITQRLFQALTDTDVRGRQVRRPAHLSEIEAITEASRTKLLDIIHRFTTKGRSFLALSQDDTDPLIDISHESLIRQWSTLRKWVSAEARSKDLYLRLVGTALRFNNKEDVLLSGPPLQFALAWYEDRKPNHAWANRYHPDFDIAIQFLKASEAQRDRDAADRERRRNEEAERELRELEQAQQLAEQKQRLAEAEAAQRKLELDQAIVLANQQRAAARWQKRAIYALAGLLLLAVGTTAYAVRSGIKANASAAKAEKSEGVAKFNLARANENAEAAARARTALVDSNSALSSEFNKAEGLKVQLSQSLETQQKLTAQARAATLRFQRQARIARAALSREETARANERAATEEKLMALMQAEEAEKRATAEKAKAVGMQTANNTFRDALFLSRTHNTQAAADKYKEAAEEYKAINDSDAEATAYFELGDTYINSRDAKYYQPGADFLRKATDAYRAIPNPNGIAAVSLRFADFMVSDEVLKEVNDQEARDIRHFALGLYTSAYQNYHESKNSSGLKLAARKLVSAHIKAGKMYVDLKEPELAKNEFTEAIKIHHDAKEPQLEAEAYTDIGFELGGIETDAYTKRALETARAAGGQDSSMEAETLTYIANKARETLSSLDKDAAERDRVLQTATRSYEGALSIFQKLNVRLKQAEVETELGTLFRPIDSVKALDHLNKSLALYSGDKESSQRARVHFSIGAVLEEQGNRQAALEAYQDALREFQNSDEGLEESRTKRAIERLTMKKGDAKY